MVITSLGDNRSTQPEQGKAPKSGMSRGQYIQAYSEFVTLCCAPADIIHQSITNPKVDHLLHAALGLSTEAGEFTDQIKKALVYGRDLDEVNAKEELGDLLWYVQLACNTLGCNLLDLISMNIRKLSARYPGKFSKEAEMFRNLDKERGGMEG